MSSEGASLNEQLLDCARRNNEDLFNSILESLGNDTYNISELINTSRDPFGNTALHLACQYGSWEVLDKILDQEGDIEIDPQNTTDGDTPLHVTVKYAHNEPEHGTFIAKNLIEVGADPRIRNNRNERPIDCIHGDELEELIDLLQGAEISADNGGVNDEEDIEEDNVDNGDDDDDN
ncbi:hypothetical protein TPHA_0A05990 [Tetrapisispora phaffii CBS 4417]|uniref:Uncharacterized protein n=1 Tax=Tetrapisispora phaffii (strain ATCC 24235 / CBS 4417 / NBRC 1672 / NRRL Y-8282 / UCD 70-5) TaxID=1071381 RepID=G8BP45_TETPH|nr:hypothetical protein TPHA_0A05990 [Tetrapisispora phaffii CBS 4417]CCE61673.1 hypothetical protein TPHA_0A05990 [Tetrapisispora phaffii CBS 4417]